MRLYSVSQMVDSSHWIIITGFMFNVINYQQTLLPKEKSFPKAICFQFGIIEKVQSTSVLISCDFCVIMNIWKSIILLTTIIPSKLCEHEDVLESDLFVSSIQTEECGSPKVLLHFHKLTISLPYYHTFMK